MQGANNEGADQTARMVCDFVECKNNNNNKTTTDFLETKPIYDTHNAKSKTLQ